MSNDTVDPEPWDPTWHPSLQASLDYQAKQYVGMAAIALLTYDSILTVPNAFKYVYRRKFTAISWLYIVAQYGTLCDLIFDWASRAVSTSTDWEPRACNSLGLAESVTFVASAIGIQGLLFSRAYAVAPKNRIVNGLLGFLFLTNVGVALSLFRWWKCDTPLGNDYIIISIIGQLSLVLFDIGVLFTILYHTWNIVCQKGRQEGLGYSTSFSVLFIRQGVFRFVVISAWSLGDAISYKLARASIASVDTNLEIALSPILLGRFLFQLRKAAEKIDNLTHSNGSIELRQFTGFRAAENLNLWNTTNISADLSGDINTPPAVDHTNSSGRIQGRRVQEEPAV